MNPLARAISASAAAVLAIPGCSSASPAPERGNGEMAAQEFVVTRDSDRGPDPCQPEGVGELMVSFLQRVNAGDDPTSSFASSFQWYSMTEGNGKLKDGGRHFVTHERSELDDYFEGRAGHDESMKLVELSLDYDEERDISHIGYVIERTADDTASYGTMATGKGAIACDEGKIELLSMGMARDIMDGIGPYCPKPEEPDDEVAVICARD